MSDELPPEMETQGSGPEVTAPSGNGMADNPQQLLPDGIGLTVEEVSAMLHKEHGVSVPKDDPVLMQVTILNAFLQEQSKLQKKHEKALAAFMGKQTSAHVEAVEKSVHQLSETLSGVTVKGIQEAAKDFVADVSSLRTTLWLCTAIIACSAIINVAVFVLQAVQHG